MCFFVENLHKVKIVRNLIDYGLSVGAGEWRLVLSALIHNKSPQSLDCGLNSGFRGQNRCPLSRVSFSKKDGSNNEWVQGRLQSTLRDKRTFFEKEGATKHNPIFPNSSALP